MNWLNASQWDPNLSAMVCNCCTLNIPGNVWSTLTLNATDEETSSFLSYWLINHVTLESSESKVQLEAHNAPDRCLTCFDFIFPEDSLQIQHPGWAEIPESDWCACGPDEQAPELIAIDIDMLNDPEKDGIIYSQTGDAYNLSCEDCVHAYQDSCPLLPERVAEINVFLKRSGNISLSTLINNPNVMIQFGLATGEPIYQCDDFESSHPTDDEQSLSSDEVLDMTNFTAPDSLEI